MSVGPFAAFDPSELRVFGFTLGCTSAKVSVKEVDICVVWQRMVDTVSGDCGDE
ncbi:hypothetical protein D9758_001772 [Tetrapyrgos nigripes]|uniref:Uncharacterized protein n=1 Tax=Tetrapyrgos nigripes TaxID=182062 RepID=A0A8H5CES3_9AGAR|nr:hypothetical protein D9758_014538 [Tetrapyrgos nigripes]KAF5373147.1 hypothetical protein D9758_001772 [Tetrapyrgos nigripes]